MYIKTTKILIALLLQLFTITSIAATLYDLSVQNPKKDIGYVVGDTFTRTVLLDVKAPYKLSTASLPVKSSSQHGIELSAVKLTEKRTYKVTHYQIELKYQVFTSSSVVKMLEVAKYPLKITHAGKATIVMVPGWQFRVSPLAVDGEVYVEHDMSPYRGPMLVGSGYAKLMLGLFLSMILLTLLGLTYINADRAWFPGMGGPFAMSYRELAGFESHTKQNVVLLQQATTSIHRAFNKTYGENVFTTDINTFLQKHPNFVSLQADIDQFFQQSNQVLFTTNSTNTTSIAALKKFCEQCRHCERSVA